MDNQETTKQTVDLAALINTEAKLATVEYVQGLFFVLRYVGKAQLRNIAQACTINRFDKKTKQRVQDIDHKAFAKSFARTAVADWKGATPERLSQIVPMNLEALGEDAKQQEIPFSIDHLMLVIENALDLDGFIQEQSTDLTLFQPNQEDELENSESSPDGS